MRGSGSGVGMICEGEREGALGTSTEWDQNELGCALRDHIPMSHLLHRPLCTLHEYDMHFVSFTTIRH